MSRPRVFVCRPLLGRALNILEQRCEVRVWPDPDQPPPREVLLEEAQQAEGLVTLVTDRVDEALLQAAPRLRVVSNVAVGYDNIDVAAATRRGVVVTHTPDVLTETTADLAWALMLAAARRVAEADRFTRAGKWQGWSLELLLGQDLYGRTLGVVGLGRIGRAVARRAVGFGMRVLYTGRKRHVDAEQELGVEWRTLDDLLAEADFVTLHTPLTPETRHLIHRDRLRRMKRTAVLVNTSRGGVVDQEALVEALQKGWIWAAGLDVFEEEPLPPDSPLLSMENVVLTPHIGSASFATRARMCELAAENCVAVLSGQRPLHPVNPEVLDRNG